jgi:heterodisulfide reductase subunit A
MKKKIGSALVVGSGISGIRSALDMAEEGYHVTLIDKAPNLGGVLTQLDYQFPTDHCGMCKMLPLVERDASSQYCLRKGLFHENIDIMLSTELVNLEGEPGKFQATLRQKPTMVNASLCIGCGACSQVCPVEVPDSFNAGLTKRKAIYLPVPHNIPNTYVVDMTACTLCGQCEKVCPTRAIDFGTEARRKFRILIVDDELIVRDSLKEWLEHEGFQAETAESGKEALEKMATGPFHLMLLDIKMPGMDGVEVLRRSKEMKPDVPVVMMTAYATVETAVEAMKIGALEYLMKPFDPETLVPLVVQLFQKIEQVGEKKVDVGSVIFAAGFESYNPSTGKNTYRYGELPNVVTSMEFERLMSGTGATQGRLIRPSDGKEIRKIAWLQCVGSREPQAGADFCSSICCMFAVKEALLAKDKSSGAVDTAIFYMDMRTFGKDFQRYRDSAEKDRGVRFIRNRIHSVEPGKGAGDLKLVFSNTAGNRCEEEFDLVVLAAGQRPPSGTQAIAEMTGIEQNSWGFCKLEDFSLTRTNKEGLFIGGSFSGLRDISESVIQASSASLEASRLIHSKGGSLAVQPGQEKAFRDVSRELPRISVVLCTCGESMKDQVDFDAITEWLKAEESVTQVHRVQRVCTQEGWEELQDKLSASAPNRVVIGACLPYVYGPRLRELGEAIGLHPRLMDVVDVRTPAFPGSSKDRNRVSQEIRVALSMGLSRLRRMDPVPTPTRKISQKALVAGGGIAGMSAALAIADHGFQVDLVEQGEELGGNLREIFYTIEGNDPQELLRKTVSRVEKHPHIRVHKKATIMASHGHVGRFSTVIEKGEEGKPETLEHGITILATGGKEAKTESYGYGKSDSIMTQHELEKKLYDGSVDPTKLATVVMIQCVDSREEPRNYCSRICCTSALKNALYLKAKNPSVEVYILYRDMMSYGFLETYFTEARKKGVIFVQYDVNNKPRVSVENGHPTLLFTDPILDRPMGVKPDVLALSTGIVPNDGSSLGRLFGVEVNQDGFFLEAESKWRPVDFIKEGVFMAGVAHSPRSLTESIAMAQAAAQRALRILSSERLAAGNLVAEVRHSLCSLCERCVAACPYGARQYEEEEDKIVVDEIMCQGCGSCAAVCPNSASVLRGYRDQQVFETIDAALAEM